MNKRLCMSASPKQISKIPERQTDPDIGSMRKQTRISPHFQEGMLKRKNKRETHVYSDFFSFLFISFHFFLFLFISFYIFLFLLFFNFLFLSISLYVVSSLFKSSFHSNNSLELGYSVRNVAMFFYNVCNYIYIYLSP